MYRDWRVLVGRIQALKGLICETPGPGQNLTRARLIQKRSCGEQKVVFCPLLEYIGDVQVVNVANVVVLGRVWRV